MAYLIDTDILIDHMDHHPEVGALIARLATVGVAVSIISYMEAYQGILRSPDRERAEARFEVLLAATPILPFSRAVARRCAELREELRRQDRRVRARALDLMVAATALQYDLTLVTRNIADYDDVPGLVLWREEA